MSLRSFHIFFIAVSVALLFGFGFWEYKVNASSFFAALSFLAGAVLACYLAWFISKIKKGVSS